MVMDAIMTRRTKPTPVHARIPATPPSRNMANAAEAIPVTTERIGIMGSARNTLRRKSTEYCSMGIRRHRLVRSTANIRIPPAHRPPKKSMSQALILSNVIGCIRLQRGTDTARLGDTLLNPVKAAAASFGVEVIAAPVHDTSELESVVATRAREPNSGLIVMPDAFLVAHREEVTSLAARYRLPAIYFYRVFTEIGGLISYGNASVDNYRRSATYVDRVLHGAKPSELPVQAPVKFELVVNLKTAKALGLDVPPLLQQRADEVIE